MLEITKYLFCKENNGKIPNLALQILTMVLRDFEFYSGVNFTKQMAQNTKGGNIWLMSESVPIGVTNICVEISHYNFVYNKTGTATDNCVCCCTLGTFVPKTVHQKKASKIFSTKAVHKMLVKLTPHQH